MAGISFGNVGGFTKGPSSAPKPPAPKARPAGLNTPSQIGAGAGLLGLAPAAAPKSFRGYGGPVTGPATPPKTSATTTAPPASPLDSTYYANLAANQLKVGNQINALTSQSQNLNTSLQDALGQLAYAQPRAQLKAEQAMNARGGLYSSVEGQQQGDIANQYQTRESGLQRSNAQKQAAIASQITGLQQGVPLYQAQQYDASIARAIKAALANPATGQAPISTPAPAAPAPAAPPAKPPAGTVKKNGTLNVNVPKAKPGQFFGYRGGI